MNRRLLVTGAGGFVGRHVQEACRVGGAFEGWEFVPSPKGMDLRDRKAVSNWIADARGDAVLHLAAQSFVPRSFVDPAETFDINLHGTLHLLLALKASAFAGRMMFASTGDLYGRVPEDALPVTVQRWPEPRNPYAVSKFAAEQLCLQWMRTEGLDVVIARPFNHIGPGQDARFVLPALATQVVAIADGRQPPAIDVGDIDVTRDFTDVRDIVAAYRAMLDHGRTGSTYLVGSGRETRVRDLLERMCALERISPEIRQDPARLRPAEQRRMAADAARLAVDTGWEPRIPLDTTLHDILKDARQQR
ncbi:GDP-mannose 4,6-dehydratase [Cognatilysobacter bugurensis]|uniref:GDP-6-deoxy-D-mannose reductase n=1 Tax=Cognatilysobacter bugurensis TaxID=543356 RepID=A0A918T1P2_9GAMM|nr:GDP-mannose 4,6-dehydratase [Lysobacter bugurensis]GHA85680.1 GDP-6-deoxy-D-mannose reductase [Lysobacter bugurensis]